MSVAETYIADVISGKQVAGQWIRKACERHQRDMHRAAIGDVSFPYHFEHDAGQRPIDFIQDFCVPSNESEPMKLMPWEQAWMYMTFGWLRADGYRRFRRTYLEIAKKNGKTGIAAALAIYFLIADGELSARVFIAAAQKSGI